MIWYLVKRRDIKPKSDWHVSLDEHLAWMHKQHQSGQILFSGPSDDKTLGIYVIRCDSRDMAMAIASEDPFTRAGLCDFEIFEWHVHQVLGVGPFTSSAIAAQGLVP